ncbi:MAG TPA: DNA repair protein RecN, partial [bacterium]|nr:DNA repair protein RecN [bacterium]
MLATLIISDIAILPRARVEFGEGLNVITGETGAGKSILVGALGLLLGERADRRLIRRGAEEAAVEAVFQLADPVPVQRYLEERGMPPPEGGALVIRRSFSRSGSGKIFVNDSPATLQTLKGLGDLLVDLHGPHEHQSLLKTSFQLDILDSYGNLEDPRARYAGVWEEVKETRRGLRDLEGDDREFERRAELLEYAVEEIEAAACGEESEEDLVREHGEVANARAIIESASALVAALGAEEGGAFESLTAARRLVGDLGAFLPEAPRWREEVEDILIRVQELAAEVERRTGEISASPEREAALEDRIDALRRLKRKYGGSVAEVLAYLENARAELEGLRGRNQTIERLRERLALARERLAAEGRALGRDRRRAAADLGKEISAHLRDLGFSHAVFRVALEDREPSSTGTDAIEFLFSPNAGEDVRPLREIASSGEISRVMLAIKAVLGAHDRIPVLVFDEIGANVGGEMGNAIGSKLAGLGRNRQVGRGDDLAAMGD